ncbi:MAG: NAD(P)H-dependent oxidoreductase [Proteobacteria bacterium]|nr:NAD(P)H-dependent oxidoreductase [Pseudomonadota bacterium]
MRKIRIVAICGSLRHASYNKRLMYALGAMMQGSGAEMVYLDLLEYQLPLFNQDIIKEFGVPHELLQMRDIVAKADGLLVVSPEYCGSITGVLKNAIDWLSISLSKEERIYSLFSGKPMAAAVATTSKVVGGSKGGEHIRGIASTMGAIMIPHIMVLHDAAHVDIESLEHVKVFAADIVAFMKVFCKLGDK